MGSGWGLAGDSEHHTHASQQGPGYMALPRIPISLGLNIPQKKGELSYSGCEVGRGWRQPPDIGLCLWGPTPATCPTCHLGLTCYCFFTWMGLSDLPGFSGWCVATPQAHFSKCRQVPATLLGRGPDVRSAHRGPCL